MTFDSPLFSFLFSLTHSTQFPLVRQKVNVEFFIGIKVKEWDRTIAGEKAAATVRDRMDEACGLVGLLLQNHIHQIHKLGKDEEEEKEKFVDRAKNLPARKVSESDVIVCAYMQKFCVCCVIWFGCDRFKADFDGIFWRHTDEFASFLYAALMATIECSRFCVEVRETVSMLLILTRTHTLYFTVTLVLVTEFSDSISVLGQPRDLKSCQWNWCH